jgi:phosphonate transport system substrate-binding protein
MPPSLGMDHLIEHLSLVRSVLQDLLATEVDVTVSQSYEHLTRNLLSGAVDAAHAPPFVCAQVEPRGVTVAVQAVRHGQASYGAALIRRKGSDTKLSNPKAIRAAWADRRAVAGYLLPVAHLRTTRRIDPSRHFASEEFYGSYPEALAAVLDGKADLCAIHAQAAVPATVAESLHQHAPGREAEAELVELCADVPGDGIATGSAQLLEPLRRAFVHLDREPAGRRMLKEVFLAERFVVATPNSYRALYAVAPKDL